MNKLHVVIAILVLAVFGLGAEEIFQQQTVIDLQKTVGNLQDNMAHQSQQIGSLADDVIQLGQASKENSESVNILAGNQTLLVRKLYAATVK